MTAPICTILDAAAMTALGDTLAQLWWITVAGLVLANADWVMCEWRLRRFLRRRRIQRIRAARMVSHAG